MKPPAALVCLLLLLCSCFSSVEVTKPGGDEAVVTLSDGDRVRVELLALTDTSLLYVRDNAVWRTGLADVCRVHVEGYSVRTNKMGAAVFISLLIGAVCIDMVLHTNYWYFAVPPAVGYAYGMPMLLGQNPKVDFSSPLDTSARQQLALYCRYPQGLTDGQWQELLHFYHQDAFLQPGDLPKP